MTIELTEEELRLIQIALNTTTDVDAHKRSELVTKLIKERLLAKAESTEFTGEREALLAKVRDLRQKSA